MFLFFFLRLHIFFFFFFSSRRRHTRCGRDWSSDVCSSDLAYTDAWFVGFSPEYTIGVWVGYDDPSRSLGGGATGAEVALPIWIDIVKQLDAMKLRTPRPDFEAPPGVVVVPMDLKSGRRGVGPCERVVMEAFIAGQEPDKDCSGATVAVSKLPYYLQRPFYQAKEAEPTQPIDRKSVV